jgi:diacylglycerol kinase (ATP)
MVKLPALVVFNPALKTLSSLKKDFHKAENKFSLPASTWTPATHEHGGLHASLQGIKNRYSCVIVVGGDGLVRSVIDIIHENDIEIGIIPMGTGNLLARNLGLPVLDRTKCIDISLGPTHRRIDLAQATLYGEQVSKHIFSVMAGIGLDADMAAGATVAKKQKLGWFAYVRPIIRSITENRQQEMSFTLDEKSAVKFKAHTAIVGNCGTLTANLLLMPDAVLDDGLLNIVVLNPRYFSGWTRIWSRLAIGGALNKSRAGRVVLNLAPAIKTLRYDEMKTLKLTLKHPQIVQLDGDSFGEVAEFDVTVLPSAISVRVPG